MEREDLNKFEAAKRESEKRDRNIQAQMKRLEDYSTVIEGNRPSTDYNMVVYISAGVGGLILVVGIILFVMYRRRTRNEERIKSEMVDLASNSVVDRPMSFSTVPGESPIILNERKGDTVIDSMPYAKA